MDKKTGNEIIQRSIYSNDVDNITQESVEYFDDYEKMMAVVDKIENDGYWFSIMKPMVSVGKMGDAKALWAIHCNGTREKRHLIWLAILRIIMSQNTL